MGAPGAVTCTHPAKRYILHRQCTHTPLYPFENKTQLARKKRYVHARRVNKGI